MRSRSESLLFCPHLGQLALCSACSAPLLGAELFLPEELVRVLSAVSPDGAVGAPLLP